MRAVWYDDTMNASIKKSLAKGAIWMSLVGLALQFMSTHHGTPTVDTEAGLYPQSVVAAHHCVKPAQGALPTGAVMTLKSWVAAEYTTDPAIIGRGLDHVFAKAANDVYSVTAFCA